MPEDNLSLLLFRGIHFITGCPNGFSITTADEKTRVILMLYIFKLADPIGFGSDGI